MQIEQAREEHKSELFAIHEICFKHHIEDIWGWDEEWQRNHFDQEWQVGEWRILKESNQVIGYLMWKVKNDHLYLHNISLLPECQGRGLGKLAMEYIQKEADSRGGAIKLSAFRTNERVLKFYLNLGFNVIEKVDTGLRMSRGHGQLLSPENDEADQ